MFWLYLGYFRLIQVQLLALFDTVHHWHCVSTESVILRTVVYYVEETRSEVFFQLLWCYCQSWCSARIKTKQKERKRRKKWEHILEWFYNVHCVYCLSLFCTFISLVQLYSSMMARIRLLLCFRHWCTFISKGDFVYISSYASYIWLFFALRS